ncbi:Uncharacterised protein [Mycobacteroides abscessus subsp. abscessus]|nr:Uncharacterised protein [Mycobacteroides abscessus subsp. abscessus]
MAEDQSVDILGRAALMQPRYQHRIMLQTIDYHMQR